MWIRCREGRKNMYVNISKQTVGVSASWQNSRHLFIFKRESICKRSSSSCHDSAEPICACMKAFHNLFCLSPIHAHGFVWGQGWQVAQQTLGRVQEPQRTPRKMRALGWYRRHETQLITHGTKSLPPHTPVIGQVLTRVHNLMRI